MGYITLCIDRRNIDRMDIFMNFWTYKDQYNDYSYLYFDINKRYFSIGILGYLIGVDF